jgi:hypothetical protein
MDPEEFDTSREEFVEEVTGRQYAGRSRIGLNEALNDAWASIPGSDKAGRTFTVVSIQVIGENPISEYRVLLN